MKKKEIKKLKERIEYLENRVDYWETEYNDLVEKVANKFLDLDIRVGYPDSNLPYTGTL